MSANDEREELAVTNFRKYLRINTAQPKPNYGEADEFYQQMAREIGLQYSSYAVTPQKPIAVLTWPGGKKGSRSVLLYSHTDVVPVFPDHWKYPPFDAHKDEEGNIYARGAQDMKCVGMQYLEAIRRLKEKQFKPMCPVHIVFGPDEEIGGKDGMEKFVHTKDFTSLNVAVALDEGLASPTEEYRLFYGERSCWWFTVTFTGNPGHGSAFIKNTAISKLNKVINRALEFRDQQEKRLESDESLTLGDVTTLNINVLKGGVQPNVVPSEVSATFDVRIAITENLENFQKMVHQWCKDVDPDNYAITFQQKSNTTGKSPINCLSPYWASIENTIAQLGIKLRKEIFPAGTDGRYMRALGIPVYGFSPMNNTPILLHDHNEYLNEKVFLKGIEIYESIIPAMVDAVVTSS